MRHCPKLCSILFIIELNVKLTDRRIYALNWNGGTRPVRQTRVFHPRVKIMDAFLFYLLLRHVRNVFLNVILLHKDRRLPLKVNVQSGLSEKHNRLTVRWESISFVTDWTRFQVLFLALAGRKLLLELRQSILYCSEHHHTIGWRRNDI